MSSVGWSGKIMGYLWPRKPVGLGLLVKGFSDMKQHIEEKHTSSTSLHHLKIDREKEFSATSKFHYVKDL